MRAVPFVAGVLLALGMAAFVAGIPAARAPSGSGRLDAASGVGTQPDVAAVQTASPSPGAQPVSTAAIARLVVPRLEIDAPAVVLGVDSTGAMQSPSGPTEVGWYNFSSRPGMGGNVVMSGHLDYIDYGPAVFWRLGESEVGDLVELVLADNTVVKYQVSDVERYDEATAPVQQIVGPTDQETVTLITCAGSFDPSAREYNQRLVVRAVPNESAIAAP